MWIPTPLEVGVFLACWPLLLALTTTLALIPAMWLIRSVLRTFRHRSS